LHHTLASKAMAQRKKRYKEIPLDFCQYGDIRKSSADSGFDEVGGQQPLRGMAMNQYGTQPNSRQTPRLQNTQKTGLGNGNAGAGWAFGAPATGNTFGGLAGGAPGLAQQGARPQQLSGFAQVMGGGSGQGPIDMR
jgi:CCR4-NOT transcription complex subunit 2